MLEKILSFLNELVPKKNCIVFNSFPAFSDNAFYLYQYIIRHREDIVKKYRIIWCHESGALIPQGMKENGPEGMVIVEKKSLKGIWYFLSAKYVIHTHGYFGEVKSARGQVIVNLWHGCGYKDIPKEERCHLGDMTIVTSEVYRKIHANIFKLDIENVYATGFPRNDKLFYEWNAIEKLQIDREKYDKIIMWLPTYRKAAFGHDGIDGEEGSFGVGAISMNEYRRMNDFLKNRNYLLVIKPHPMDTLSVDCIKELDHIKAYTTKELNERGIELYELLVDTDVLLSDYSSVVIDYLLLDRPIAMVLSDMKEYQSNRGFVLEPLEEYFPGPIISCYDELISFFENMDKINSTWTKKRESVKALLQEYSDANSAQRVCELLWGAKE